VAVECQSKWNKSWLYCNDIHSWTKCMVQRTLSLGSWVLKHNRKLNFKMKYQLDVRPPAAQLAPPGNLSIIFIFSSSVITLQLFLSSLSLPHLCFYSTTLSKGNVIKRKTEGSDTTQVNVVTAWMKLWPRVTCSLWDEVWVKDAVGINRRMTIELNMNTVTNTEQNKPRWLYISKSEIVFTFLSTSCIFPLCYYRVTGKPRTIQLSAFGK
jgi:hypothetical protein